MLNLKSLLEYQQTEIELKKMLLEIDKDPDVQRLEKTRGEFAAAKQAVTDSETAAGQIIEFYNQAKKFYDESVKKIKELTDTFNKTPEKNESERKDILAQMEVIREKLSSVEKKMGDRRQKSEKIIRSYVEAQERGKKMKDIFGKLKERIDGFKKEKEPKINELTKKLKTKRTEVDPKLLERYATLAGDNKYPPLAESKSTDGGKTYTCLGCGLSISQASKSELIQNGFSNCDNCRRMIYSLAKK